MSDTPYARAMFHAEEASRWANGEKSWTNQLPVGSDSFAPDALTARAHAAAAQAWVAIAAVPLFIFVPREDR